MHIHQASWSNLHPVHLLHLCQAYAFLEPTDATDAVRIVEPVPVFATYVVLVVSEPVFRERLVFWFSRRAGLISQIYTMEDMGGRLRSQVFLPLEVLIVGAEESKRNGRGDGFLVKRAESEEVVQLH